MPKRSRLRLALKEYKLLCLQILQRDKYRCQVPRCRARKDLHAHHIIFRSSGGDDASWNLITMCAGCHDKLHNRFIVIHPLEEGKPINADEGVRWQFIK